MLKTEPFGAPFSCDRKVEHSVLTFLSHKNAPRGSHCGGKEACCQKQPAAGGESCGAGILFMKNGFVPKRMTASGSAGIQETSS